MGDEVQRVTIEQVIERFRGFAPGEYPRTEALLAELARLRAIEAAARVVVADDHQMRSVHDHWTALYAALGVPRGTEAARWAAMQAGRRKTDDEIVVEYKARGIAEMRHARESYGNDRWGRSMFPPLMQRALDELYAESAQRRIAGEVDEE